MSLPWQERKAGSTDDGSGPHARQAVPESYDSWAFQSYFSHCAALGCASSCLYFSVLFPRGTWFSSLSCGFSFSSSHEYSESPQKDEKGHVWGGKFLKWKSATAVMGSSGTLPIFREYAVQPREKPAREASVSTLWLGAPNSPYSTQGTYKFINHFGWLVFPVPMELAVSIMWLWQSPNPLEAALSQIFSYLIALKSYLLDEGNCTFSQL